MISATYKLELRLDGVLLGDVRSIAQNLVWARRRTIKGVDSISFTLNDVLFDTWCTERNIDMVDVLKPYALDCRVIRDGTAVVGGYLATLPAYSPNQTSANLDLQFDGYENLLGGVYMAPQATQTGRMGDLVNSWIQTAQTRSQTAGKAFGFTQGTIDTMNSVDYTFENYKSIKDAISDRADNTSGAGKFDVYWHPDRTYDIKKDSNFGEVITDYTVFYPMRLNGVCATSISASEESGFASTVIGLGAGEVSNNSDESTVITSTQTDSDFVDEYGYYEILTQDSSVSEQTTLNANVATTLSNATNMRWNPEITLSGVHVAPAPLGEGKIWIGDTIKIRNDLDPTGMTSGYFRVNELEVSVSETGAEEIKPTIERTTV